MIVDLKRETLYKKEKKVRYYIVEDFMFVLSGKWE